MGRSVPGFPWMPLDVPYPARMTLLLSTSAVRIEAQRLSRLPMPGVWEDLSPTKPSDSESPLGRCGEVPWGPGYMGSEARNLILGPVPTSRLTTLPFWAQYLRPEMRRHALCNSLHFSISVILWLKAERSLSSYLRNKGGGEKSREIFICQTRREAETSD